MAAPFACASGLYCMPKFTRTGRITIWYITSKRGQDLSIQGPVPCLIQPRNQLLQVLFDSFRMITVADRVLPPMKSGTGSQLTLLNGTLTVTVMELPGAAEL